MPPDRQDLPAAGYAAALASVGGIGAVRLRRLLEEAAPPVAWASMVAAGAWRDQARQVDVAAVWDDHRGKGIDVLVLGDRRYPAALATDPEAPAVLFALGDPAVIDRHPRVAVVGTRSATRYGLGMAAQLGADLTAAGVAVVSGLAPGIDSAAHEGATAARLADLDTTGPPIGVVAGAVGNPSPQGQARLWQRVAQCGVVLSESAEGAAVPRWRFPQRNRILAALADVVVVVECHAHGGSLHTVRLAAQRGLSVGAVPGSVRSPASAGTNDLLADGCFVVRDAADVLVAVGLARAGSEPVRAHRRARDPSMGTDPVPLVVAEPGAGRVAPVDGGVVDHTPAEERSAGAHVDSNAKGDTGATDGAGTRGPRGGERVDAAVLSALEWEPSSVEQVLRRTGLPLGIVSVSLDRLTHRGRVRGDAGWWERV